jgi:hypothetical protein
MTTSDDARVSPVSADAPAVVAGTGRKLIARRTTAKMQIRPRSSMGVMNERDR